MERAADNESIRIFVSYSHKADSRWFQPDPQRPWMEEGLIPWLAAALREQRVKVWYDRGELEYGDQFKQLICNEIDKAQCAILIVSTGFLTSDFVKNVELPRIKDRAQRGELVVIPILAEPSHWDEIELLSSRLVLPGRPKTLIDYIDSEREWRNVRFQILDAIKRKVEKLSTRDVRVRVTPEATSPVPDTPPFPQPEPPVPAPRQGRERPVNNHRTRTRMVTGSAAAVVIITIIAFYVWQLRSQSAEEPKAKPSCDTAARLRTEIWPDMAKYVIPFFNAPESQHADILRDNPVVGKTLMKYTNEFCPALLDCGGAIPGMLQSDVTTHREMCSGLVKAVKGSK